MRSSHALLVGLALVGAGALCARSARSDGDGTGSLNTAAIDSLRPPIDRPTGRKLETATFALG